MKILKILISLSVFISLSANALLEVNIIKSREAAFPIVIAPFEISGNSNNVDISKIIRVKDSFFNVKIDIKPKNLGLKSIYKNCVQDINFSKINDLI